MQKDQKVIAMDGEQFLSDQYPLEKEIKNFLLPDENHSAW